VIAIYASSPAEICKRGAASMTTKFGFYFSLMVAGTLLGCSDAEPSADEVYAGDPAETADVEMPEFPVVELTSEQLVRVCRLGHGFRVGRDPDAMTASLQGDEIVRIAYTRDDGRSFRYDCIVEGSTIRTRMIDEGGPGTGPGVWSGRGSRTTFEINGTTITIRDVFSDGSSDEETFDF
jgi:hypothetical protein